MTYVIRAIVMLIALAVAHCNLCAQDESDDNPKENVNLGMTISAPLNPTARFVDLGLGISVGAGYNFTRRHAVVGEFMWNSLFPAGGALNPIRAALQDPSINAGGNVFAFTGNYRFELRGKTLGTYFIGGGGWYYRNTYLSRYITTGTDITCTPVWVWFGFYCESGTVGANQTIRSTGVNSLGANGGIGFTARVGDAPYRMYVESRYHYAPSGGIHTQLVAITVGIRY